MKTIHKSVEFKKSDTADYDFEGWLAKYGNKDRHDDIIAEGAFKESIERKKNYVLLENHNSEKKIGYLKAEDRKKGVYIYGKFFENDSEAIKVKELVKVGAYSDMSVGLGFESWDDIETVEDPETEKIFWKINKAYIREGSIVLAPANTEAVITSVKSALAQKEKGDKEMKKNYDLEIEVATKKIQELEKEKAQYEFEIENADENSDLDLLETKKETIAELEKSIDNEKTIINNVNYEKAEAKARLNEIRNGNEIASANANANTLLSEKGEKNSYMESKYALEDFSQVFAKSARESLDFEKEWKNHLIEKGITPDNVFTPPAYVDMITDILVNQGKLYNLFTKVSGQAYWKEVFETGGELGKGHKAGTEKVAQNLQFISKQIVTDMIYKYLPIDKKMLRESARNTSGTNPLLTYVTRELVERTYGAAERAAVIGDGLLPTSDEKITSFEAVTAAGTEFVTKIERSIATDELLDVNTVETLLAAIASKYASNTVFVMHRSVASYLRMLRDNNVGYKIYETGTTTINGMEYNTINQIPYVEVDWMPTLTEAKASAGVQYLVAFNYSQYKVLEDSAGMEFYRDFVLKMNQEEFLAEINAGGALMGLQAGAYLETIA